MINNVKKTYLGIEFGSTRIKACLTDDKYNPIASGGFSWENCFEDGFWTYSLDLIHDGAKGCFKSLKEDVLKKYGSDFKKVDGIGISGMMHGYLAFDKDDNLLVPFRTWRNATTSEAATELTELFNFNIPQRWSIAHLYQAILNNEPHIKDVYRITTLAGYIHYRLTGEWAVGIGEASGIFPVDGMDYDKLMLDKFDKLMKEKGVDIDIYSVLPKVKTAGEKGAKLTEDGAAFLDESGTLKAGIPVCPPEGDAGTGMVATNSVRPKKGNVSAGTSVFSMLVLEKPLCKVYEEIDVVTTPDGSPVAMVHGNNGCSELDAWVSMFGEFSRLIGVETDISKLYEILYKNTQNADADCNGMVAYNYLAAEPVAGVAKGTPMYFHDLNTNMTLANFFKAQLYATVAVLKIGMNILVENEKVVSDGFNAHGGLFKVEGVAQAILANALKTPVTVSKTAGEGGAWGMALLAAFMMEDEEMKLSDWLDKKVFSDMESKTINPDDTGVLGFEKYFENYIKGIGAQNLL